MSGKEMVNHPDHYYKGKDRIECIHLIAMICEGYSGIAAFDIGQCKYTYRCGCKSEKGMDDNTKAIQDSKKYTWYLEDFKSRALQARDSTDELKVQELLPKGFYCEKHYVEAIADIVAKEFTWDKADNVKPIIDELIREIYSLRTFEQLQTAINLSCRLTEVLAQSH